MQAVPYDFERPAAYDLADWHSRPEPERIAFLRAISDDAAHDTEIRQLAVAIISDGDSGFHQRAYEEHAARILSWVQRNVKYVNEHGEVIQHPKVTLRLGFGDCDDLSALMGALYGAIGMPWKYVLAGKRGRKSVRWVEGQRVPRGVHWKHIYNVVGWPNFAPETWRWADASVETAPLGWDVLIGDEELGRQRSRALPELGDPSVNDDVRTWSDTARDIGIATVVAVASGVISAIVLDAIRRRK